MIPSAETWTVRLGWAVIAAGAAAVFAHLADFAAVRPEYLDQFLLLAISGWAFAVAAPSVRREPRRPDVGGLALIAAGTVLLPAGWYLQAQMGFRRPVVWWVAGALMLLAFGLLLWRDGRRRAWRLAFPVGSVLFALPRPSAIEGPLQSVLQSATTAFSAAVLSAAGLAVERRGFVIGLPGGDLGVEEACSGVKSAGVLMAVAAAVAYHRRLTLGVGAAMVLLALPVTVAANTFRVTCTGLLQEHVGRWATQGWAHDLLGFAVIVVGLGLLMALFTPLRRRPAAPVPPAEAGAAPATARAALPALALIAAALAGCLWAEQHRAGVIGDVPLENVAADVPVWSGRDVEITDRVRAGLGHGRGFHRVYADRGGRTLHLWVLLWNGRGDPSRGAHNPDSCWPLQGCTLVADGRMLVRPDGSAAAVPASVRRYRLPKGGEQMLVYWGQLGPLVLSPEGDTRDAPALMAELLTGRRPLTDRTEVFVLAAADVTGDPATVQAELERLCGRAAGDLYTLWPGVAVAPAGPGR